jgi:acetyltransferase
MDPRTARRRATRRRGTVRLDARRRVSIRPIDAFDRSALIDFYAALSDESSRRRFLSWARPPTTDIERLVAADGLVGVLRAPDGTDGAIVAHAVICPSDGGSAEVAFAVRDDVQGHGIGRALVAATIAEARRHGLARLAATTCGDNGPMRRLLLGAGCPIDSDRVEGGEEEIVLRLRPDMSRAPALAR